MLHWPRWSQPPPCARRLLLPLRTSLPGDLSGNWQGTLKVGKDLRIVINIYKGDKDGWSAKMYSIDQTPQPIPVASVTRQGSAVTISVDMIGGSYEGKLAADGKSISGTWTQGGQPFPLTLLRATPETAWEIPEAPKPPTPMAADADPSFEVATIKPNPSGAPGLQGLVLRGRSMVVRNGSLDDLVTFAYSLQVKQIVNGPGWMDSDRYDIEANPDQPGTPNTEQMRIMAPEAAGRPLQADVPSRKARSCGVCADGRQDGTEADAYAGERQPPRLLLHAGNRRPDAPSGQWDDE